MCCKKPVSQTPINIKSTFNKLNIHFSYKNCFKNFFLKKYKHYEEICNKAKHSVLLYIYHTSEEWDIHRLYQTTFKFCLFLILLHSAAALYRRVGAIALQCTRLSMCLCHNLHQGFIFPSSLICPSMVALICMSPYRHALTKWPHLHIFFAAYVQSPRSVNVS